MSRKSAGYAVAGALALAIAIPVVAQKGPTSLLPPGFGEQPADEPAEQPSSPSAAGASKAPTSASRPALQLDLSDVGGPPMLVENAAAPIEEQLTPEELAAQQAKYDLPPTAKRSLDRIGPLTDRSGGFAPNAFGITNGRYLAALMQRARAPFVSRWGSILLRRALLSATDTPGDINGADWAAERAWLLVRMGEADAARMLVQSVDADNYTRRLASVAMQAYLASADPTGICSIIDYKSVQDSTPGWKMAEAFCASFSGDQGTASAILNQAQRRNVQGVDYRLSEKIVGAGVNARRSVKIEWDGVDRLTAWRFGLATAANVDIPAPLMAAAGPRVRAWQARAPMLSLTTRLPAVEDAAVLGVFSSSALVDFYAELAASEDEPDDFEQRANMLGRAYTADRVGDRIDAMRTLWTSAADGTSYLGLLAVSRAAAALPVADASALDVSHLVAAMLSAGYDASAARWARAGEQLGEADGALAWALLAVGAPRIVVDVAPGRISDYAADAGLKGKMLVAGLAGLARMPAGEAQRIAQEQGFTLAPNSAWARAIDDAARRREKGTVAVLAAIGMQTGQWRAMPPAHLYHIVSALHRVGLDPEARMIAAEAITRS